MKKQPESDMKLREQLRALSNRYAIEILRVLNPKTGEIIPSLGWDNIVEGILERRGIKKGKKIGGEATEEYRRYEHEKKRLQSGGTLYDSMQKLERVGFVQAIGTRGRKQRLYRITHDGRLAITALDFLKGGLESDSEIADAARTVLKHKNFVKLLPTQSKFIKEVGNVKTNYIIQMPPGSGKTFLAMVIILTKLREGIKCLYLTPYTSLSRQVITEYGELLERIGFNVVCYDSQSDAIEEQLKNADFVVAIYESVLRDVIGKKTWIKNIGLVVVDELTQLNSPNPVLTAVTLGSDRSSRLDLLVTLLKTTKQIVTLSSRFGETEIVAKWLKAKVFRPSMRLKPDEFIVVAGKKGIRIASADGTHHYYSHQKSRLDAILEYIGDYKQKSFLIVTGSRENCEYYANRLSKSHPRNVAPEVIERVIGTSQDHPAAKRLRKCLEKGIAFYHAGLDLELRRRLEQELRKGTIKCITSTTGIAEGASFPFDCVIIMFNRTLHRIVNRARYLQIAGRIGEYHLAAHGGQVFLALPRETIEGENADNIATKLLHRPIEPLVPSLLDPYLIASLTASVLINNMNISCKNLEKRVIEVVSNTLRGCTKRDFKTVTQQSKKLTSILLRDKLIETKGDSIVIGKEMRYVVKAGLNLLDYLRIRDHLKEIQNCSNENALIDLLLQFRLIQSARPKTIMPSDLELEMANIPKPSQWYQDLAKSRERIKRLVLKNWVNEVSIEKIIESVQTFIKKESKSSRYVMSLDEGDLIITKNWCADISLAISRYFTKIGNKQASEKFYIFGRRLRYGLKEDTAKTDLTDLVIEYNGTIANLTRREIRTLFDNGYCSIDDIVKKDIDRTKRRPARTRFVRKCGLDFLFAKEVYKAALRHIHKQKSVGGSIV